MDAKTQEQRRLNKIAARRSNQKAELRSSDFGAKFIGKANAPSERELAKRCEHIDGGKKVWIRRAKTNPKPTENPTYMIPIIKGGLRCPNAAVMSGKCIEHLSGGDSK